MRRQAVTAVLREALPLWATMPVQKAVALRFDGKALASGGDEQRVELLTRSRTGEHIELELDCTPFLQLPDTPNRNFLRFRDGGLVAMGRTGKGSVFLRDHRQGDLTARGGTVLASKMTRGDGGIYRLSQTIRLHEPWAVQMALTGSLDRFSIGWNPTGPVTCSVCKSEILEACWHFPGETVELDSGEQAVEWVFHSAELLETSAVCVPAVVGTTVDDIRAALAVAKPELGHRPTRKGKFMAYRRIAELLALSASAGESEVIAGIEALQGKLDDAGKRLAATRAQLEEANAALASERAAHEALKAQLAHDAEESFIRTGIEAGKLRPNSKLAKALRDMFALDREAAQEMLDSAPVVTPVGTPRQSNKAAPPESSLDELTYQQLKNAGIADPEAYFAKYGPRTH